MECGGELFGRGGESDMFLAGLGLGWIAPFVS